MDMGGRRRRPTVTAMDPPGALRPPGDWSDGATAAPPHRTRRRRASPEPVTIRVAAPTLRGVVRTVLMITLCAIGLYLVWRVRTVIRLVAISLFFALTLMPVVDAVTSQVRMAPRALVILTVFVLLLASVALVGYVVVPSLVKEVQAFSHDAPHYAAQLRHNATFRPYDNRYHL